MMWRRAITGAMLIAAASIHAGCICNAIGCDSSATLRLRGPGVLALGRYDVIVTREDGRQYTCSVEFPEASEPQDGDCFEPFDHVSDGSTLTIALPWLPDFVHVEVFLDGSLIAEHAQPVAYTQTYPNGKRCGGPCRNASVLITLDETEPV